MQMISEKKGEGRERERKGERHTLLFLSLEL